MQKIFRTALMSTLILSACSAVTVAPQTVPPHTTKPPLLFPTTAAPNPKLISTAGTPHIEQPPDPERFVTPVPPDPQDCGYQWATQDLADLSNSLQKSIRVLQADAVASAYIFGENCIRADGGIGAFLPRETDFNITLRVRDLNNQAEQGSWIVKVMQIIAAIPPEQVVGPLPGRVFLIFQSDGDQRAMDFGIDQYHNLPSNLGEVEIFQALQVPR